MLTAAVIQPQDWFSTMLSWTPTSLHVCTSRILAHASYDVVMKPGANRDGGARLYVGLTPSVSHCGERLRTSFWFAIMFCTPTAQRQAIASNVPLIVRVPLAVASYNAQSTARRIMRTMFAPARFDCGRFATEVECVIPKRRQASATHLCKIGSPSETACTTCADLCQPRSMAISPNASIVWVLFTRHRSMTLFVL
jgi:hypothetical protein